MFNKDQVATKIVKHICEDNGIEPFPAPESLRNAELYDEIAVAAENFNELHPDFLTDEIIEEMAVGEPKTEKKYSGMKGYSALSEAMTNFFEMYDDGDTNDD